jgi:hypothetical protein
MFLIRLQRTASHNFNYSSKNYLTFSPLHLPHPHFSLTLLDLPQNFAYFTLTPSLPATKKSNLPLLLPLSIGPPKLQPPQFP